MKTLLIIIGLTLSNVLYSQIDWQTEKSKELHIRQIARHEVYNTMKLYLDHCKTDSVVVDWNWIYTHGEFIDSASYDPVDIKVPNKTIQSYNGYYVDYYEVIEIMGIQEPTFEGYVEWLEKLLKE